MFEIEKNVPLHRKPREKNAGLPFHNLIEPMDSFFVPASTVSIATVKVSAGRYARANGVSLTVQSETDGCRVYRL